MSEPTEPKPVEQKVLKFFGHEQAYWTANGALIFFALAQIGFGWVPTFVLSDRPGIRIAEFGVAVIAGLALVGIVLHTLDNRSLLARWCYLLLCYSTGLTTLLFVVIGSRRLEIMGEIVIFLLLTTGGLVALSMHVEYGGRRKIVRTKQG